MTPGKPCWSWTGDQSLVLPCGAAERWTELSMAGEEDDLAGLNLAGLVEKCGKSTSDDGCVGKVLREGFGRDENQSGMFSPCGLVLGIQRYEVLDVGGDQYTSRRRSMGEDLFVRERDQRWVGHYCEDVMALGAKLFGNCIGKHFIEQQRSAHGLPGKQLAFALPCLFGRVFSGGGGTDFCVDFLGVGRPVSDGGAN